MKRMILSITAVLVGLLVYGSTVSGHGGRGGGGFARAGHAGGRSGGHAGGQRRAGPGVPYMSASPWFF
jgi:hypothetical protein